MNEEQMANTLCKEEAWANGRENDIVNWLENFQPEHRSLALQLLRNIQVYSKEDCRRWCQKLHDYLPEEIRQSPNVFYVGLGLPSESGSLVSYYYRTTNNLMVENFLDLSQAADANALKRLNVRTLVFLDDFIGSGNQTIEFWRSLSSRLGQHIDTLDFYYSAFFSHRDGKTNIEKHTKFKVQTVRKLDESDKAFGVGSDFFPEYLREIIKKIFREYGERLSPSHPLGFRDGQMLIILDHNTPNNTLPVLWSSEANWFPLFKRYDKVHLSNTGLSDMGRTAPGSKVLKRRVVMFIDQVDLTPRMAGRTDIEAAQVLSEQVALTVEVIRRYGGSIVKSLGDRTLIQFSSRRDAFACGFALQQHVKDRNAAQSNSRLMFELRVGIDSGEVVMSPDGNLVGSAANRAARVCSLCPPGEVYFTELAKSETDALESKSSLIGIFPLESDQTGNESIYRLLEWVGPSDFSPNPFIWRGGITSAEDFFDRDAEQRIIRECLQDRQNIQIIGPGRIGKTSLLLQVERTVKEWEGAAAVTAYTDFRSPRSFTLDGWLEQVSRQFNWSKVPRSLADFSEAIESTLSSGIHPVLFLDEFEELALRPTEFTRDFFVTLRSCGQRGLSIITTTRQPLSELTEPDYVTSSYYNTFALVLLTTFSQADAEDFVYMDRHGMIPFTSEEAKAVLDFAKGHPLALQVASFQILEARRRDERLTAAMRRANDDMKVHLPSW